LVGIVCDSVERDSILYRNSPSEVGCGGVEAQGSLIDDELFEGVRLVSSIGGSG
jgi:hypothetical protein